MAYRVSSRQGFSLIASEALSVKRRVWIANAAAYDRRLVTILRNISYQKSWLQTTRASSGESPSTSKLLSGTSAVGPEVG